jgi:predicted metal-dependent hydrolase
MLSRLTFLQKPVYPEGSETRSIEIDGRKLELTVKRDSRARRMTLRIEPGGQALKMTVPRGLPQREIDDFLSRQQGWLMTKLARYPRTNTLTEGRYVTLRGVPHRIERTGKLRGVTEIVERDGENILLVGGAEDHLARRLREFLKAEARKELGERAHRHAAAIGRRINQITFKDTKSRWGSCSHDGNLSFSWRIVMAPPYVIDYLAAHEVAHLAEMNHSDRFWKICEQLCPEMHEAKHWLKRNGGMLHVHDFG